MLNPVHVSHVKRNGHSLYVVLPASLRRTSILREGDAVAVRQAGDKLILERVALEELAKIRTGELEVRSE
jgi:antitoxin component of MazEF toxin-antitoxin module